MALMELIAAASVQAPGTTAPQKIQAGNFNINIVTANNAVESGIISFPVPYNSPPTVIACLSGTSGGNAGYSYVTVVGSGVTTTGFQAIGDSYLAQTLNVSWLAIGN